MMHGNHIFERSLDFVTRYYRRGAFDPRRGMRASGFRPSRRWPWWGSVAAAAAILIAIGLWQHPWTHRPADMVLVAEQGPQSTFFLPDSTKVELSAGSTLSYDPETYGNDRRVMLKGLAFLTVTRDEKKPFRVVSGTTTVTVLGTEFSVNEHRVDSVTVAVTSGCVRVANPDGNAVLTRGMSAVADSRGVVVTRGRLTVSVDVADMSLSDLSAHLAGMYGVGLRNIPASDPHVTLAFEGSPDELAALLNSLLDTDITIINL